MTKKILLLLLILLALYACERQGKELAGVTKPQAGAPQYSARAQLATVPAPTNVLAVAPGDGGGELDGAALFVANCSACHQATGLGVPGAFPPLDGSKYVTGDNIEKMASIMLYGLQGPIKVKGVQYNSVMAPLGATLNNEQLAAIATYIRGAWSNKAGAVEASTFQAMRDKWGSRAMFNISELGEEE